MRALICLALAMAATGCTEFFGHQETRSGASSSLVDYLYPEGQVPPDFDERIPQLNLPVRVGLAFVPPGNGTRYYAGGSGPSEAEKNRLLELVRERFKDRKYIRSIEVIPETYLRSTKGFEGLSQVARLYSVDVMALVSYDQVAATGDNKLALTYWTIVGAYVIPGTENEVNTFVDTAVFDVASRKLLFRAPGTDRREMKSTAIEVERTLQSIRAESFSTAVEQMSTNLGAELDRFAERLKTEPQLANVTWKTGSGGGGGGGSADCWMLVVLAAAFAARRRA